MTLVSLRNWITSRYVVLPTLLLALGSPAIGGPLLAPPGLTSNGLSTNIHRLQESWLYEQRAYPLGTIPKGARVRAFTQREAARKVRFREPLSHERAPRWVNIGPAPIVAGQVSTPGPVTGRIVSIAVDPGNPARWLVGAADGGIWETRNSGSTWAPKTDDQASLNMGVVAFAPGNPQVVYVGTGEGDDDYAGVGLLQSTDDGSTWQLLGESLFTGQCISGIIIHPTNSNLLVVSTTWGYAGRGVEDPPTSAGFGIYKSTDAGAHWNLTQTGRASDLKVDPSNFNHQLAAASPGFWTGYNLYRSLNAGDNWTVIHGPWTSLGGVGRMVLAISPSSPATAYVSAADTRDSQGSNYLGLLGIWRTDNLWASTPTWTRLSPPSGAGNQLFYDQVLSVDPTNPNILYFGTTPLFKHSSAGWQVIAADYDQNTNGKLIHPDQHALTWVGTRLIIGNDGGIWSTTDGGATFNNHNSNLAITQFYYGAVHPGGRDFVIGGAQDNGTSRWEGTNGWTFTDMGDGAEPAISPNDPDNNWVTTLDNEQIDRNTGAGQFQYFVFSAQQYNYPNIPFVGRLALAPTNEDIVITGTSILIKTTNFFSALDPDWNPDSADLNSPISALAFALADLSGDTYAFGTADGQLRLTTTGSGFDAMDLNAGNGVPGRYVTALAFQPNNPNTLYVTLSGFDEGTPGKPGHVFRTDNALSGSPVWVNVSPPVDLPHNAIAIDPANPNNIYVGTDIGVWFSADGGGTWSPMGPESGMPNVAVYDLKIQPRTGRVFAFTFGRGAFMLDPNAATGPPSITGFVPTSGAVGTIVTITGTKFDTASSVQFSSVAAACMVNSSTQMVATVPAGAVTGPITVTTAAGSTSSAISFIVSASPVITDLSPDSGSVGTVVTISGVNLTGATSVIFGGTPATTFTVNSSTQITATVPANATTGKVTVTTPNGTAQSAGSFSVVTTPVISGFSPLRGPIGASITITGANFVSVSVVAFNGTPAVSRVVNSAARITATVPAGATSGPISVTTANGTTQSGSSFTVIPAPAITGFTPANGAAGTVVTISGARFSGATSVTFNGVNATSFDLVSDIQIIATTPAGVSTGPIAVTTPGGTATSATAFSAIAPPSNDNFEAVQNLSGSSGTVSGNSVAATKQPGEPLHAGNDGGKSVWYRWTAPGAGTWTFNTQGSTFDTLLAVYTGSTLSNLVEVASDDDIPGTNTSSVTFTATVGTVYQIAVDGYKADVGEEAAGAPAASGAIILNWDLATHFPPQIAGFSPAAGSPGSTAIISGVNFLGLTGVVFNGSSAGFTVNSNLQVTATVPAGATTGPIQVTKPSESATSTASFVVNSGPANDNFTSAQMLVGNAGTAVEPTAGATKVSGEPNHAGNTGGSSVWFVWTAPNTGT